MYTVHSLSDTCCCTVPSIGIGDGDGVYFVKVQQMEVHWRTYKKEREHSYISTVNLSQVPTHFLMTSKVVSMVTNCQVVLDIISLSRNCPPTVECSIGPCTGN